MDINLNQWCSLLGQVNPPLTGSHSWICRVKRNGSASNYEVLTDSQYQDFFKQNSWWNSSCKKLSLNQIVFISREHIEAESIQHYILSSVGFKVNPAYDTETEIYNLFHSGKLIDTGFGDKFVSALQQAASNANIYKDLANALQNMSQRAANKNTIEKTKGVWGRIKAYIYSLFFDKTKQINSIIKSVPYIEGIYRAAIKGIRVRALMSMESVESGLRYYESDRTNVDDEAVYTDPRSIRQNWLKRFHPDKIKPLLTPEKVTSSAATPSYLARIPVRKIYDKESFDRVVTLIKIWSDVEKLQKGEIIEPGSSSQQQILLIEDSQITQSS